MPVDAVRSRYLAWRDAVRSRSSRGELRASADEREALERFVALVDSLPADVRESWERERATLEAGESTCSCGHPRSHHDSAGSCFHVVGCATGCDCVTRRFERYVAIGDSTSEGLDDPDGHGGYRGWANRLADRIARQQGALLYANLAVRGRTTRQIREEQLESALAMKPDLSTVVAGTNDALRRHFDAPGFMADLEHMQSALIEQGAIVLTFTLPDLTPIMPFARILGSRVESLNEAIRAACAKSGAILCDLARYPIASDPRLWSDDRLHANSLGHARIADALAFHLGLPDTDMSWAEPLPPLPPPTGRDLARAEVAWGRRHLLPWIWRHLNGRSSGDGRVAKRPELTPVSPETRPSP